MHTITCNKWLNNRRKVNNCQRHCCKCYYIIALLLMLMSSYILKHLANCNDDDDADLLIIGMVAKPNMGYVMIYMSCHYSP